MFGMLLKLVVVAVMIRQGLILLKKRKQRGRTEEIRRLLRLAETEAKSCKEILVKEREQRMRSLPCTLCGTPTTTRCARCKLVRYCSGICQIIHWRQGHKYECFETKDNTKKSLKQIEKRVRHLEEELAKSKKEDSLLESEGNNWSALTNFVSRRLNNLMRESDENQIAEEERIVERSKQDKHTRKLESEYAKAAKELREEQEQVRRLKREVERITTSNRKIEETRYAERREQEEYIQMLKDGWMNAMRELDEQRELVKFLSQELVNTSKNLEYATTRADLAENGWIKAVRELEEEREFVKLKKTECEEIRQSSRRQMEKKELELANAIKAAAAAEEKLSDLETDIDSSDDKACAICLTNKKDVAFGCGHMTCGDCMLTISNCHICREPITSRLRLFPG
ncbi:nuclear-pore anchor-like [Neltuma alba]|uniref:nuclear-pore anchor-like n=1 Tax=Neltuma alba TaxID=207710 RepID=UPI0010A4C5BA|nr:nuclear-pore anchor-like [Prosopis alba]